jgi:hypothetical protein
MRKPALSDGLLPTRERWQRRAPEVRRKDRTQWHMWVPRMAKWSKEIIRAASSLRLGDPEVCVQSDHIICCAREKTTDKI